MRIETAESFIVNFVVKNNDTKAVLFDKTLAESIIDTIHKKLTIFVDGIFATVLQLENDNC